MNFNPERAEMFSRVWSQLRVPVRPGIEGLELYRLRMQQLDDKRILVLGATPELVDMALDLDAEIVVSIERNQDIIEAMRRLGEQDWARVKMIVGDWLRERPEFIGAFNCVVCDGGLLFLEYPGQWEQLFHLVYSYLTPDGIFVAKEWAEPPGDRDYQETVTVLLEQFEVGYAQLSASERLEAYMYLVSELRLATFIKATGDDCSFDQKMMVRRLDALLDRMISKYPEPQMVEIAEGALKYLARSQPGTTDTVAGAHFDKADVILSRAGFRSECFPLPDRPVSGANYMFVSRKQ